MQRLWYRILAILLLLGLVQAMDIKGLLEKGNAAYKQGNFRQAIEIYEKAALTDAASAIREYNLGCAYFNEEEYGRAILHFEKARQLRPRDADIKHNLEFTRLFLKDRFDLPTPMPLVGWMMNLRDSVAIWELRDLELILFVLLIIVIIFWRLRRNYPSGRTLLVAVLVTGLVLLINVGWLWNRASNLEHQHAVLLVDQAPVSSAPVPGSSTLFVIHEGTSGEILDTTDGWYEIRLPDGKTGWITNEVLGLY